MEECDIRKYANLMNELNLTGLEITEDNKVVRLERSAGDRREQTKTASATLSQEKTAEKHLSITSPMVGVFYPAPAENAEPFVRAGAHVKKGDTLCIIETMKLMNEITAEQDGEILEVCAQTGQVVEYGSILFRMGEQR